MAVERAKEVGTKKIEKLEGTAHQGRIFILEYLSVDYCAYPRWLESLFSCWPNDHRWPGYWCGQG